MGCPQPAAALKNTVVSPTTLTTVDKQYIRIHTDSAHHFADGLAVAAAIIASVASAVALEVSSAVSVDGV